MLSVNGLFQLDWDLSPVNKLQSAIHYSSQRVITYSRHYRKSCTGPGIKLLFFLPKYFSRGMHREFITGKLTLRPLRSQSSIRSVCKLHFIFLDEFSKPKLAAQASWFLYKFPNFDAEIVSKCKEIQRQRGEKSGRGQTCGEIKKSVERDTRALCCGVCSVFSKFMAEFRIFMSLSHWGYLTHCEKPELSSWSKAWRMEHNIFGSTLSPSRG